MPERIAHRGGCHCGRVQFEVRAPAALEVDECNCSICTLCGYLHLIVEARHFSLLCGEEFLTTYQFGTRTARHRFCRECGIKSFYVPRSHPDGISVNARCLDPGSVVSLTLRPFDGRHWEQGRDARRETS